MATIFHKYAPSGKQEKMLSFADDTSEALASLLPGTVATAEYEAEGAGTVKVHYLADGKALGYWPNGWTSVLFAGFGLEGATALGVHGPVVAEYHLDI